MKKLLFCLLFSSAAYAVNQPVIALSQPTMSAVAKEGERDDFDEMADEMDKHMENAVEIKEPSTFQMLVRRVGGPIVMAYVKVREKMNAFWAWLWIRNKNKNMHKA